MDSGIENIADKILDELRRGLSQEVLVQVPSVSEWLISAKRILCYGVGREGLMMKALSMRLYHLGLDVHVVGDMTAPPIGKSDLLFVSAGPGTFSTVSALTGIGRKANAQVACITAEQKGEVPRSVDHLVIIPTQTMATDQSSEAMSILPMGSLYEALMFLFFELLVLDLREKLNVTPDEMRSNHTNLE